MSRRSLSSNASAVSEALAVALEGGDLSLRQVVVLLEARGEEQERLIAAADQLRGRQVGDDVSYVVNRNVNFTNVCVKRCGFCAFSRTYRSQQGYFLPIEEVIRRAQEAQRFGATEVCVQAGLPPAMEGDLYIRICEAIKKALPEMHVHAFSPEEVLYGSRRSGLTVREYLTRLRSAGIGSLPGTSAEILVQGLRDRISPGRISVSDWTAVICTAHELGIPTTSTMMFGHLETAEQCARHLLLLRDLQRRTGGFTEFVPLSFIHEEAPMYLQSTVPGVRPGATEGEVLRVHAAARLTLGRDIPNIQVSWVKEGLDRAGRCLSAGANDLGGTLMNESISTAAGSRHGQMKRPAELRACIRAAGRRPLERSTLYRALRRFASADDAEDALDRLPSGDASRFGSYPELIRGSEYRFGPLPRKSTAP